MFFPLENLEAHGDESTSEHKGPFRIQMKVREEKKRV